MKQKKKVATTWSPSLAYIIGIIVTDGSLSKDERHIVITSKDKVLLEDISTFLSLSNTIGTRLNISTGKKYYILQIGDKNFYNFLLSIHLTPNKTKTIKKVDFPEKYFSDFLRGCIDGDGNIDVYMHKESAHKQLRIRLASASHEFLLWMSDKINKNIETSGGWIYSPKNKSWHVLTYGKKDSIKILHFIYNNKGLFLERKFKIAKEFIEII